MNYCVYGSAREDIDYKYDMKRDKVFENLKGRNR